MRMWYTETPARISGTVKLENGSADPFTARRVLDGVAEMDAEIDRLQRADRCRRRGCGMPAEYGDLCERDHDYGCDEHS